MSISGALSNAVSGLTVTARRLAVTSDNIANALTEGYAVRDVALEARNRSGGVRLDAVLRAQDPVLTAQRREADADANAASTTATLAAELNDAIGAFGEGDRLSAAAEAFDSALRRLADRPNDAILQSQALQGARDLATAFNDASSGVQDVRSEADRRIASLVDGVNADAEALARVNRRIVALPADDRARALLIDEQERLTDRINAALPIAAEREADGRLTLRTREGLLLVGRGEPQALGFTRATAVGPQTTLQDGGVSGLTLGGRDITPDGPSAQAVSAGAIAALFVVRDETAVALNADLDGAALDLVQRFQDPGLDATVTAPLAGLFSDAGNRPTAPPDAGLAGRLALPAILDDPTAGWRLRDGLYAAAQGPTGADGLLRDQIAALAARRDAADVAAAPGPASLAERLAAIAESGDRLRLAADASASEANARRATLAETEGEALAVDQDAELQALIALEQAYAANAQVISTANSMLQRLSEIV
ncbi:MAG: flagellar hook-associated protein FlgK [Pseudomonadota bacterium]